MGPVVTAQARDRIAGYVDRGERAGATLVVDGRGLVVAGHEDGFFVGPTVIGGSVGSVVAAAVGDATAPDVGPGVGTTLPLRMPLARTTAAAIAARAMPPTITLLELDRWLGAGRAIFMPGIVALRVRRKKAHASRSRTTKPNGAAASHARSRRSVSVS